MRAQDEDINLKKMNTGSYEKLKKVFEHVMFNRDLPIKNDIERYWQKDDLMVEMFGGIYKNGKHYNNFYLSFCGRDERGNLDYIYHTTFYFYVRFLTKAEDCYIMGVLKDGVEEISLDMEESRFDYEIYKKNLKSLNEVLEDFDKYLVDI